VTNLLNAAIQRAQELDNAAMSDAQRIDPRTGNLQMSAHSGFDSTFITHFATVEGTSTACGCALATANPVWVSDITASDIFADTPGLGVMLDAGSRAVASFRSSAPEGALSR
jgi:hypothetical protein